MAKFVKGQSGNPGGRAKGLGEIREIARQYTGAAIDTLVNVMENKDASPSAQVAAASALLDRGWGRPAQTIDANINNQQSGLDHDSLTSIGELLKRATPQSDTDISERRQAEIAKADQTSTETLATEITH